MLKNRRKPRRQRQYRQIVQIVFLLTFTFLLVKALTGRVLGSWMPLLTLALITVVLTLVLGRVWCGWVCPMGTLLYWTRFKGAVKRGARQSNHWRMVKCVPLFLLVAAVLLGFGGIALEWLSGNVVTVGIIIALLVAASVGLNLVADLFWCRYLCPLGGALSLISRISPMRRTIGSRCSECSLCVSACPMGAIDPLRGFENMPGECTVCMDCLPACRRDSIRFRFSRPFGGQRRSQGSTPPPVTRRH